jgi:hypothetical protein
MQVFASEDTGVIFICLPFMDLVVGWRFQDCRPSQHPVGSSAFFFSCPPSKSTMLHKPYWLVSCSLRTNDRPHRMLHKCTLSCAWLFPLTLEDRIGCPETSVTNYQSVLRSIPEEWRPCFWYKAWLVSAVLRNTGSYFLFCLFCMVPVSQCQIVRWLMNWKDF